MEKRNIKLTLEYDGTNYCGWQKQPNAPSIEETLERAITKIVKEEVSVTGSGRTDSSVHAMGQVANFYTSSKIPSEKFALALNTMLPKDIAVKKSEEVNLEFHSRYDAVGKEYKYMIYNSKVRSPLKRNYAYHVNYKLDREAMKVALDCFLGEHDFRGFMSTGSSIKGTVRTINYVDLVENEEMIEITFRGTGFLYNMVRIIVGTVVDVGIGKIDKDSIVEIIESKDRNRAGHTAPPEGLYLSRVFYDE